MQVLPLGHSPLSLVVLVQPELLLVVALVELEHLPSRMLDPIYHQQPAQRVRAQPWHQCRRRQALQL